MTSVDRLYRVTVNSCTTLDIPIYLNYFSGLGEVFKPINNLNICALFRLKIKSPRNPKSIVVKFSRDVIDKRNKCHQTRDLSKSF